MAHIVTATMIGAKLGDTERYLDKGVILPEGVDAKERKRLLALGLVEVVKVTPAQSAAAKAKADAAAKEAADQAAAEKAAAEKVDAEAAAKAAEAKTATK